MRVIASENDKQPRHRGLSLVDHECKAVHPRPCFLLLAQLGPRDDVTVWVLEAPSIKAAVAISGTRWVGRVGVSRRLSLLWRRGSELKRILVPWGACKPADTLRQPLSGQYVGAVFIANCRGAAHWLIAWRTAGRPLPPHHPPTRHHTGGRLGEHPSVIFLLASMPPIARYRSARLTLSMSASSS